MCTLYKCKVSSVQVYSVQVHSEHSEHCKPHWQEYSEYSTVYKCKVYGVQCLVYKCTLYSVQCTSAQYTVSSVQVNRVHCTPHWQEIVSTEQYPVYKCRVYSVQSSVQVHCVHWSIPHLSVLNTVGKVDWDKSSLWNLPSNCHLVPPLLYCILLYCIYIYIYLLQFTSWISTKCYLDQGNVALPHVSNWVPLCPPALYVVFASKPRSCGNPQYPPWTISHPDQRLRQRQQINSSPLQVGSRLLTEGNNTAINVHWTLHTFKGPGQY